MERIRVFDGLRGLAALIVMLFHVVTWTTAGYEANYRMDYENVFWKISTQSPLKLFWGGNEAVILFYLIGGFVLVRPYLNGKKYQPLNFFKKRFKRMVLPYWAVLFTTILLIAIFHEPKDAIELSPAFDKKWADFPSIQQTIGQFFMWDSNLDVTASAFWSIVQEWRIAFVMPVIGMLLYRFKTIPVIVYTLIFNRILAFLLEDFSSLHRTNYYFLFFFAGAILCKHFDEVRAWYLSHQWIKWTSLFLIPIQWLLLTVGIEAPRRTTLLITAIGFIILIFWALESPVLRQLFESKPLQFLGKISFSLYLTHSTSIVLVTTLAGTVIPPTIALLLSTIPAVAISWLWFEYVEKRAATIPSRIAQVAMVRSS